MAVLALVFTSCSDDKTQELNDEQSKIDMSDFYVYTDADIDEPMRQAQGKSCYSMVNLNRLLNENPGLEKKMYDIEYQKGHLLNPTINQVEEMVMETVEDQVEVALEVVETLQII